MKLTKEEIEQIIVYEVIVDCYSDDEYNMGWAMYMEENMYYPFEAEYLVKKKSGKAEWKKVLVMDNETDEDSFSGGDYYVNIELDDLVISTRLDDLRKIEANQETLNTIQVWNSRSSY